MGWEGGGGMNKPTSLHDAPLVLLSPSDDQGSPHWSETPSPSSSPTFWARCEIQGRRGKKYPFSVLGAEKMLICGDSLHLLLLFIFWWVWGADRSQDLVFPHTACLWTEGSGGLELLQNRLVLFLWCFLVFCGLFAPLKVATLYIVFHNIKRVNVVSFRLFILGSCFFFFFLSLGRDTFFHVWNECRFKISHQC